MKRIVLVSAAVQLLAFDACAEVSAEALAAEVAKDVSQPVRPGGVNGQEFWNAHADWFMYPPSFDFRPVTGAVRYRFTVLDDQHVARTLGDAIVNVQDDDGRVPTHWNISQFHDRDYDWVNCMLAGADALGNLAAVP